MYYLFAKTMFCFSDERTESQKKAERIKAMKQRKAIAAIKFLPSNDPWSVHLYDNYSKPESDKKKEIAASQVTSYHSIFLCVP